MPVVGVYLKDFPALPSAVADDNIIPIAVAGNQISYKTTVSGIITDARITSKLLTGLSVTGGAVVSTDTILQAFGKVQNQINGKQGTITLTTTGSSGAATLIGSTLNIPNYGSALSGYVPYTGANQTLAMGTNNGITLTDTGTNSSIVVNTSSIGLGGIRVNNDGIGVALWTANNSTGVGLYSNNQTTGTGLYIDNISTGKAIRIDNAALATGDPFVYNLGGAAFMKAKIDYLGNITGNSFIKTGGTSAQILAADGSVITAGTNITISGGVISASGGGGGSGTVTSVAALTLGTSGTDLSSSVANPNTTPVITLNVPTASATNRGALSSGDWTTFNGKQDTITLTTTGTSGAATLISNTLNIPDYGTALSGYLPLTGGTLSTTNITETLRITNAGTGYALYVQSNSYFQGDVTFQNGFKSATNTFTLPAASGTLALTSDLSGYLPLSGGTLTGALNGTSASFSSTASASAFIPTSSSIPTNGMYLGAANTLNFATNSGSRMSIGTTGSVTMVSTLSLGNYLTITNANTFIYGGTTVGSIQYGNSTSSTHLKTYGATHATLANVIQLTNNSVVSLTLAATGAATFASTASATAFIPTAATIPTNGMYLSGTNTLDFATNSTNRLSISSAGVSTFTAANNPAIQIRSGNTSNYTYIGLGRNSEEATIGIPAAADQFMTGAAAGDITINNTSGKICLGTNGVTRLTIPTNGGVQSNPAVGSNAFTATVSGSSIAYLTSLASTSDFSGYWQVAGNFAGSITHPTNTTTNYNVTSDYRLKENIKPLSNGLESILKLKPVTGNYINDETKMNMPMFLAHEVKEVIPIAVTGEKDAMKIDKITGKEIMDIQQLDASKLIPHMVKAIQELKAEIDILKNK